MSRRTFDKPLLGGTGVLGFHAARTEGELKSYADEGQATKVEACMGFEADADPGTVYMVAEVRAGVRFGVDVDEILSSLVLQVEDVHGEEAASRVHEALEALDTTSLARDFTNKLEQFLVTFRVPNPITLVELESREIPEADPEDLNEIPQ